MKLKVKDVGNVKILELSGKLVIGEPEAMLRNAVQTLYEQGFVNLVFNMKHVSRLDSAGMGEMCASLHHVKKRGGRIHLLLPSDNVLYTIGLVGLRLRFPVFTSEIEAVAAFAEPPREDTRSTESKTGEQTAASDSGRAEAASTGT